VRSGLNSNHLAEFGEEKVGSNLKYHLGCGFISQVAFISGNKVKNGRKSDCLERNCSYFRSITQTVALENEIVLL
jgi:hypothetical protein